MTTLHPAFKDMAQKIGIADAPELLQQQFFADAGDMLMEQALTDAMLAIDEKRADTLMRLLDASTEDPEDAQKDRAVWQYVHDAVPEFEQALKRRGKELFADMQKEAVTRDAK
jgi:L-lactate utilization protein LutB